MILLMKIKQYKKYSVFWDGSKNEIKAINRGKENDYGKDHMKIKFNFDDDLPLNKPLKFHAMTITIKSIFEEGDKLYLQVFLEDALYELEKCYNSKKLMFQKELTAAKQVHQRNAFFLIIGSFKMLDVHLNHMFVTCILQGKILFYKLNNFSLAVFYGVLVGMRLAIGSIILC